MEVATKDDIERVVNLIQQFGERVYQRFEQVDRRFVQVDKQFGVIESHLDRIGETMAGIQTQMAAFTRWADRHDRETLGINSVQTAQERAIDALAERVTKLENERKAS